MKQYLFCMLALLSAQGLCACHTSDSKPRNDAGLVRDTGDRDTSRVDGLSRDADFAQDASTHGDTVTNRDSGVSLDTQNSEETGVYHQSIYTCCGRGQGVSCCTADKGLLGFDIASDGTITPVGDTSKQQANCFPYGGVTGACAQLGEAVEGKDICALCCPGLVRASATHPGDGGACVASGGAPMSASICIACGDGVCGAEENRCNCPADCP
jgi:hypothetical protein